MSEKENYLISSHISSYIEECYETAVKKGWWIHGDRNFGELCALLHSEISEAFEEYRAGHGITEIYFDDPYPDENSKPEGIPVEFADLLIRLFDLCGKYKIPIVEALDMKIKYNKTRPYRHGNKKA